MPLDLLFYPPSQSAEFIVVEKRLQKLSVFEHRDQVKLLREFVCATGQNPGTKLVSGDSRTPEGIYFITEIYEDKQLSVFGSRAFHLDYPNIFDAHADHRGTGIFIHGTNKKLVPNSTNGCIALDNRDLDELAPYLTVNTVPIIVLDALSEPLVGKSLRLQADTPQFTEILGTLSAELARIPAADIQALSFLKQGDKAVASIKYATYEQDRLQYREQLRTYLTRSPIGTWRNIYSVQSQEKNPYLLAIRPSKNELVTKLPSLPQLAEASLAEPVGSPAAGPFARSVGIVTVAHAEPVATLADQPMEPARPAPAKSAPPVRPTSPDSQPVVAEKPRLPPNQEVLGFVEKWRSAWVAKDIETYIGCYSPSFKSGGLNREGWRKKKVSLNKRYSYIAVSIKNIKVKTTPSGATVSFFQSYKSDHYENTGTKILQLTNSHGWQIESETM